jgi:hypothetical protein
MQAVVVASEVARKGLRVVGRDTSRPDRPAQIQLGQEEPLQADETGSLVLTVAVAPGVGGFHAYG